VNRLTGVEEFLDGPLEDASALAANLRDLRRLNRLTGGAGLSVRAVRSLLPEGGTILDVGTGAADIPVGLLRDAERRGVGLAVTATDGRQEVLDAAVAVQPGLTRTPGLTLGHADGRRLAWADGTFDVAHVSLVLHHLDPDEAIDLLAELRRVARIGVVVNDLIRGRLAWLGAWLLTHTVAASRYTRHDGPMSVRRAYTQVETAALVEAAGLAPVAGFTGFLGHRYAIAAVHR
jgi:ubiquinone/menaquinone biosynthesis C-methylase UbiE